MTNYYARLDRIVDDIRVEMSYMDAEQLGKLLLYAQELRSVQLPLFDKNKICKLPSCPRVVVKPRRGPTSPYCSSAHKQRHLRMLRKAANDNSYKTD